MKHLFLLLLFILPLSALADTNCNVLTIEQVNAAPVVAKGLKVDGYVSYAYRCPACVPGVQCNPCMDQHFIISTENSSGILTDKITDHELVIFAPSLNWTKQVIEGQRYRFTLAPDTMKSWKFNGEFSNSFARDLQVTAFETDPPACKEK